MKKTLLGAVVAFALSSAAADAAQIAIFGDNRIADLYGTLGHTVTIVDDSQLSTAGFLDSFDMFVYTRDGFSFGTTLSAAAAANVKSFVDGNIVLLNGDFQDDIGEANTDLLFSQILTYLLSGSGKAYLGEFTGSVAAFSSNSNNLQPISLVAGAAGPLGFGQGGSEGDVLLTAAGAISPVLAGVSFPYNPDAVEFGADVSGVNPAQVLARFTNGNPAIIAGNVENISDPGEVPEPATLALVGGGLLGLVALRRRLRR
jgi:hypothetical protein